MKSDSMVTGLETRDAARMEQWMKECIALAARGGRAVSPNPMVGAMVIREGEVIGRGWHKSYGGPHAEVHALHAAGSAARGATLVVTLEPCNHAGKTPPCTEAIVDAGISRVIIGMRDPNPRVTGGGVEHLERAGIPCSIGVLEEECRKLNAPFIVNVTQQRPYIILKIAQTLDGFIAPTRGTSRWITGEESRRRVHEMRAACDAVLVGAGTIRKDDASLTVRDAEGASPRRVVLTSTMDLPARATILTDNHTPSTIVLTSTRATRDHQAEIDRWRSRGITVLESRSHGRSGLSLAVAMRQLLDSGIGTLLVEGGMNVFSQFLRSEVVDRIDLFIAPKIIGSGTSPFGAIRPLHMADAVEWNIEHIEPSGEDVHITVLPRPFTH